MKCHKLLACSLPLALAIALPAQVASHVPSKVTVPPAAGKPGAAEAMSVYVPTGKAVVKVNGTVLSDRDLLHEMYALFPYAAQHGGFPKSLDPEIRRGAKDMLVFEELVYQQAERQKLQVAKAKIDAAESALQKRLGAAAFKGFLQAECNSSREELRRKIRRSLMIESFMKSEVADKAVPTIADEKQYYTQNLAKYTHGEELHLQTISIIAPPNAGSDEKREASKHAASAYAEAQKAKSYQQFGLLAERVSEDDWRVNMGDRKWTEAAKLPPPVVEAVARLQPGQVSPLIQLGPNFTIVRLVERKVAGKDPFESVRAQIKTDLTKMHAEQLRAALNRKLRSGARVEEM